MLCRLLIFQFFCTIAAAEYRVFVLRIYKPNTSDERLVKTVFDHIQFPEYNPLNKDEQIEIWDTWKCWDRTAPNYDYCPKPSSPNIDYQPAA